MATFVTFGLFWGSWAVMVFNIQHTFALSDSELGIVLALAIAVAGASSAVMAHLADRVGARRLLWIALFAWSVLLVVMSAVHQRWAFVAALVAVMIAGGSIDTAMNAEASHRLMGNPAGLVRFHALFNIGRHRGRGRGRDRAPCRRLVALGLARRRPGRTGGRRVDVHHRLRTGHRGRRNRSATRTGCTRCSAYAATGFSSCWPCSPWPR